MVKMRLLRANKEIEIDVKLKASTAQRQPRND